MICQKYVLLEHEDRVFRIYESQASAMPKLGMGWSSKPGEKIAFSLILYEAELYNCPDRLSNIAQYFYSLVYHEALP